MIPVRSGPTVFNRCLESLERIIPVRSGSPPFWLISIMPDFFGPAPHVPARQNASVFLARRAAIYRSTVSPTSSREASAVTSPAVAAIGVRLFIVIIPCVVPQLRYGVLGVNVVQLMTC